MDFLTFCRLHGVTISALPPMGVWRRFRTEDKPGKRNGAVKYMGDHGFVQNHATMTEIALWRPEDGEIDPAKLKRLKEHAERNAERDKLARRHAIERARQAWARAEPLTEPHPYLVAKGLEALGCHELRVSGDKLLVPVLWHGERGVSLVNIQSISPEGEKLFRKDAPKQGACFIIERPRAAVTALVEGLATGLAVYQSVRMARVVVCFDAGNLLPVVEQLRKTGRLSGSVVACADNDHGTLAKRGFNPGLDKARNVADLIGCGVAHPGDINGTDWADALQEYGEGGQRKVERQILACAKLVMARETAIPP